MEIEEKKSFDCFAGKTWKGFSKNCLKLECFSLQLISVSSWFLMLVKVAVKWFLVKAQKY